MYNLHLYTVVVYFGSRREGESWNWAWVLSTRLARHIGYLELLLKLMFVNPPELPEQTTRALPVRYLCTICFLLVIITHLNVTDLV